MDFKQIFSKRLKSAREMRGLSMADLSALLGNSVTPQAIYKYERGKMLPGSTLLIEISQKLGMSPDYFFRPFNVTISGIKFRKKTSLAAKDRKAIEGGVKDLVERYVEVDDICGVHTPPRFEKHSFLVTTDDEVASLAYQLRDLWGLGNNRIANVIRFLESLGVIVVEINAAEAFDGLSGYADDIPVVVINKEFPPERKRFTALHELGHLVMDFPEGVTDHMIEGFCHLFASELLLPTPVFKEAAEELLKGKTLLQDLAELQKEYGISIDALMYKAKHAGLISESKHRHYHILKNTNPSFRKYAERSRIAEESSDRFERMVFKALDGELISTSKAASLLEASVEDVLHKSLII